MKYQPLQPSAERALTTVITSFTCIQLPADEGLKQTRFAALAEKSAALRKKAPLHGELLSPFPFSLCPPRVFSLGFSYAAVFVHETDPNVRSSSRSRSR